MKAVIQRVTSASVSVDGNEISKIGEGLFILLGVSEEDTESDAEILAKKTADLRIFEDENGKMNLSVKDISGETLVVSQFTLCADTKKGNRPSFIKAKEPKEADRLYHFYMEKLKENGIDKIGHGSFGADMLCNINNNGPVTIILDTEIWRK